MEPDKFRKVSIIIPCYLLPNNSNALLNYTGICIESIHEYFGIDYELIIVDNGSPIAAGYLQAQADLYIRNKYNLGYAPAVNQGLKLAKNYWIMVINNDIEFYSDWAKDAIDYWQHTKLEQNIGVISSHHSNKERHDYLFKEYPWEHFFGACWMINQDTLNYAGYLDEAFKWGMFEDKDYARRIDSRGYKLIKGGWVKHVGNATWGKLPNQEKIFFENKAYFEEKWK